MKKVFFPLVISFLMVLSGCQQKQQEPVQVSAGHGIFLNHCVGCHQGGGYPPGPNAAVLKSHYVQSEEKFIGLLREPRASGMPPFPPERLSDEEAHELYIFIKTQLAEQTE